MAALLAADPDAAKKKDKVRPPLLQTTSAIMRSTAVCVHTRAHSLGSVLRRMVGGCPCMLLRRTRRRRRWWRRC